MGVLRNLEGMEAPEFKRCTLSDLDTLRQISLETFADAFADQNDPGDFREYLRQAFAREQLKKELSNPGSRFYFLYWEGDLAGYAKINEGDAQTEPWHPDAVEIERIYIRSPYQGKGLGGRMLLWLRSLAAAEGKACLWLGVWEENRDAIRFYERHGFVIFGKHPYYIGSDRQMDWMMRLDLP